MASTIDHLYTASKSCPDGIDRLFLLEKKEYVVVDDSHIQRVVVATAETTVTQQVSYRPIKCQSRLWPQRGTKVNGSHHCDNPRLRPFLFVCVFLLLSLELGRCSSDLFLSSRPRTGLATTCITGYG